MNLPRPLIVAMLLAVLSLAAACQSGDAPVNDQQTQPSSTRTHSVYLPQIARDGPAGTFHYAVQAGDTVFSLAQRFGTTVATIVALNGLDDPNDIEVGQVLIMPLAPPTPTPTATPTSVPSGPSQLVTNGPRGTNRVALTFDMGGRVDPALDIMNFLIANNVSATIFMTGSMVDNQNTDAGRQVLALVAAHPELFELANHSYNHPDFTTLSANQMRAQLADTEAAIAREVSLSPRPLFRPPFGAYNQAVLNAVGPAGYSHTIMWDVDTIDWLPVPDGGPTPGQMTSKVLNNAQGGSIVLMHLGGYSTLASLPAMVQGLRDRGFELVTVGTMLGLD